MSISHHRSSLKTTAGAFALAVGFVIVNACTGFGESDTPTTQSDAGGPDVTSGQDVVTATDECPPLPAVSNESRANCGIAVDYYAPSIHLDACSIPATEHGKQITSWPLTTPANAAIGAADFKGGLYCANGFNAHPGVKFRAGDGFTMSATDAAGWKAGSQQWAMIAVFSYEQKVGTGDIVFARVSLNAGEGFLGPALIANFVYPPSVGALGPLAVTNNVGVQLRAGPKIQDPNGQATESEGYSAVSKTALRGPIMITAVRLDTILTLQVNGGNDPIVLPVTSFVADGAGLPMFIGHSVLPDGAFIGTISELVFWDAIDSGTLPQVQTSMKAKWGLP